MLPIFEKEEEKKDPSLESIPGLLSGFKIASFLMVTVGFTVDVVLLLVTVLIFETYFVSTVVLVVLVLGFVVLVASSFRRLLI